MNEKFGQAVSAKKAQDSDPHAPNPVKNIGTASQCTSKTTAMTMVDYFLDGLMTILRPSANRSAFDRVRERLRKYYKWLQTTIGVPFSIVSLLAMASVVAWSSAQYQAANDPSSIALENRATTMFLWMVLSGVALGTAVSAKFVVLWREGEKLNLRLVETGQELSFLVIDILREAVPGEPSARKEHERICGEYQKYLVMRLLSEDSLPTLHGHWLLRGYVQAANKLSEALFHLQSALADSESRRIIECAAAVHELVHRYCYSNVHSRRPEPLVASEASSSIVRAWINLIHNEVVRLNLQINAKYVNLERLTQAASNVCMATRTVSIESLPFRSMLLSAPAEVLLQLTEVMERAANAMKCAEDAGVRLASVFRENIELRRAVLSCLLNGDDAGLYRELDLKKPSTADALTRWEAHARLDGTHGDPLVSSPGYVAWTVQQLEDGTLVKLTPHDLEEEKLHHLVSDLCNLVQTGLPNLYVDLAALQLLPSRAIGTFMKINARLEEHEGRLILLGVDPDLHDALRTMGITEVLDVHMSETAAPTA